MPADEASQMPQAAAVTDPSADGLRTTQTPVGGPAWQPLKIDGRFPGPDGRYLVRRFLSAGGQGSVYVALDRERGHEVALKIIRPDRVSGITVDRLALETRTLLSLPRIPEVPVVFDAWLGSASGSAPPYIAMEYLPDAKPLNRHAEEARLSHGERLGLLAHVCGAVGRLHERRVIHRDLKPTNILVDPAGRVYVIDFGLALGPETRRDHAESGVDAGGGMAGTPEYMSPEQARGGDAASLSPATDVYALGVTAYELLLGGLPYDAAARTDLPMGQRRMAMMDQIRRGSTRTPESAARGVHPRLSWILNTALAPRPHHRFAEAGGLARALSWHRATRGWREAVLGVLVFVLALGFGTALAQRVSVSRLPINAWYQRVMMALAPMPTFDQVLVCDLDLDDATGLNSAAARLGLPEWVGARPDRTIRPLMAALAARAMRAGAAGVAIDVLLNTPASVPGGDELAASILAKEPATRGRVALVSPEWRDPGVPNEAPLMVAPWAALGLPTGPPIVQDGAASLPRVELAYSPARGLVQPSLTMLAAAAARGGGIPASVSFEPTGAELVVRFDDGQRVADDWRVPITMVEAVGPLTPDHIDAGPRPPVGHYALLALVIPDDAELVRQTVTLATLLAMSDQEFAAAVRGRVVLVGSTTDERDQFADVFGHTRPGVYAHAAAVESLLDGRAVPWATRGHHYALAALVTGLGVLWWVRTRGAASWWRWGVMAVGVVAVAVAVSVGAFAWTGLALMPYGAVCVAAFALPAFVVLDRVLARWI